MPKRKRGKEESPNRNAVSDHDDDGDTIRVVNAPTAANKCIEKQVALLLEESSMSLYLDAFIQMELNKEENFELRKAFEKTDLVKNSIKIINIVKENKKEDIGSKVLRLIVNFTHRDKVFRPDFMKNGAIFEILEILKLFPNNKKLQINGFGAILNISNTNFEGKSIIDFIDDTTLDHAIEIMKRYPETECIQHNVISFLYDISRQRDDKWNKKMIEMEFPKLTLDVLKRKNANIDFLSESSCKLLINLMQYRRVKDQFWGNDGIFILGTIEKNFRKKCNDKIRDLARKVVHIASTTT